MHKPGHFALSPAPAIIPSHSQPHSFFERQLMSTAAVPTASPFERIARAAGLVMVLFVASRALGLVREIVIGAHFGASAELDAYLAAFRLPDLLFTLVAGGALASAFIPTFSERLALGDRASAWDLAAKVANLLLLALTGLAMLAALLARPLVEHIIAPGFTPEQQALAASLMRWMLISTVIFGISGLVMGILNAFQHFLLPALAPVFYNLSIIVAAVTLAPQLGVRALVIGVVVGAVLHLLVQAPGLIHFGARWSPATSLADPGVREVMKLMAPRVLGLAVVQINFMINVFLASGLVTGSISALNYAWLIMLLPQGIFAQAIATAAFPTFAHPGRPRRAPGHAGDAGQHPGPAPLRHDPRRHPALSVAFSSHRSPAGTGRIRRTSQSADGLCPLLLRPRPDRPFCGRDRRPRVSTPSRTR